MKKNDVVKTVEDLAMPIVTELNFELVDVEFVKEDNEWFLRIYIDNEDGINLDDCALVSKALDSKLDEVDPISVSYYLEVSSPGLDRKLKKDSDFERFSGKQIKINFNKQFNGKKTLLGILKGIENNEILIEVENEILKIDRELTKAVRLNEF